MNKRQIKAYLKDILENETFYQQGSFMSDEPYIACYIGSFMALDPCGRYHHVLSPNGLSRRCENFWDNLDTVTSELNCWIESGEGDPTDIYLCRPCTEEELETETESEE